MPFLLPQLGGRGMLSWSGFSLSHVLGACLFLSSGSSFPVGIRMGSWALDGFLTLPGGYRVFLSTFPPAGVSFYFFLEMEGLRPFL